MVCENGEEFQTLFDEKRLYKLLSTEEQEDGSFIFRAELVHKEERGMSDEERVQDQNAKLRKYRKKRLEGDLQLEGYILLGWIQEGFSKKVKRGYIKEPGQAAYLPVTGSRWVYVWKTHGEYTPHPDPIWGNKRWTHIVDTNDKPKRMSIEKLLTLLTAPKPLYDGTGTPDYVWMPSVPLWLLDNKKDMRPMYLTKDKQEERK